VRAAGNQPDLLPMTVLALVAAGAFINLMAIPAFEDEGTQLRAVWRLVEARDWLLPLVEGKPLEAWPMAPLVFLGIQPLLAIRAVHVLAGMAGALLTYRLALRLTGRVTAFVSALLFAMCPFTVYLQRFALSDILLCTCGVWVLLSFLRLIEAPDWKRSAMTATALMVAAFCKLPVGFVFLGAIPLGLLLMPGELRRGAALKSLAATLPALTLALAIAAIAIVRVRHGHVPGFGLQDLVTVGMGAQTDIARSIGIAPPTLIGELTAQLTWPVFLLATAGLAVSALSRDWRQRWLILMGLVPLLGIGLLARFWYSRYLMFSLPPLIVCATLGWQRLATTAGGRWRPILIAGALAASVGLMGQQSARLILSPTTARWSPLDRFQYFQGWGSGYGYPEAAKFIVASPDVPASIYSLDGHGAYQLRNYLPPQWNSRVEAVYYGPNGQELRDPQQRLQNLLSHTPAWIIIAEPLLQRYLGDSFGQAGADRLHITEVIAFDKPGARARLGIYQVTR
jgi:hypothetical protein